MPIQVREHSKGISVSNEFWEVEHSAAAGGTWSSVKIKNGTNSNLLRQPLTSAIRFVKPTPGSDSGIYISFEERYENSPRLKVEQPAGGALAVIAEGTYRDAGGNTIPVGYRRRTEYHEHGLVWTTLDIMSDSGCDEVVEIRALELPLRSGLTDCFARFHPTQAGGADLLGGRGWFDLSRKDNPTPFLSRFTPLQILLLQRDVEGIEVFPGSELAAWDCSFKPDPGLGLFMVAKTPGGIDVQLSPYCLAYRRIKLNVKGAISLKLGIGLPQVRSREAIADRIQQATIDSRWPADDEIKQLARNGVKLLRFKNDYREDGQYWRSGAYPPYDAAGMRELLRVISSAHNHGMKIVAHVSLKELHPETAVYSQNAREWMHAAAPSLDIIHTWSGGGERGALMCLKSGWVDFRKQSIETIASDLPWDGICLDWATWHPCCHLRHGRAPFHSDVDEFLYLIRHCRQKLGGEKLLAVNMRGSPSIVALNVADVVFVNDDEQALAARPNAVFRNCNA